MRDEFRNYKAEKAISESIQDVINFQYGFISCGKSFDELIKELNNATY